MDRVTLKKENSSQGDYKSYEFSNSEGHSFELTISGSTLATFEANNPDKTKLNSFIREELPQYLFKINQSDPTTLGSSRYDLTTYDKYFNPNIDVYRRNLDIAVADKNFTKVIGNLAEFQSFKDVLEKLLKENEKYLSREEFVAFKDQLANLKYQSYPYYGFFLILIGELLEKLNLSTEKLKLLNNKIIKELVISILDHLNKAYPNYLISTKFYQILERRNFIKLRKYLSNKKLDREDKIIASVLVLRHKYAHGNARNYNDSCRLLGIEYINPETESEFEANIRCVFKNLTSVLIKL